MKRPLYNVLRREWQRMTSRRLYLGVCIVLPLFCLFFMATIFGSGQMENIPVGIVDKDNTATSRQKSMAICPSPPALNSVPLQEWMPRFLIITITPSFP